MPFDPQYHESPLSREELSQTSGAVLLEFGATWCGICQGFAPELKRLFDEFPEVTHLRVEDGPGKRLGRSFKVKLWPTLVFVRDGEVVEQMSRPSIDQARRGFRAITADRPGPAE